MGAGGAAVGAGVSQQPWPALQSGWSEPAAQAASVAVAVRGQAAAAAAAVAAAPAAVASAGPTGSWRRRPRLTLRCPKQGGDPAETMADAAWPLRGGAASLQRSASLRPACIQRQELWMEDETCGKASRIP